MKIIDYAKKNVGKILLAILLIFGLLYIYVQNIKHNPEFINTNALSMLQLIIAVVVSYYFVQRKNDERKQIEILDSIVRKTLDQFEQLHVQIEDYAICVIDGSKDAKDCAVDRKILQSSIRLIHNRLSIMLTHNKNKSYIKIVDSISKIFCEYTKNFEEVYVGVNDGRSRLDELKRLHDLLSSGFDSVQIELYFPSKIKKTDSSHSIN